MSKEFNALVKEIKEGQNFEEREVLYQVEQNNVYINLTAQWDDEEQISILDYERIESDGNEYQVVKSFSFEIEHLESEEILINTMKSFLN